MAHDFSITYENEMKDEQAERRAYFFGFCDGVMYKSFNMEHHSAGLSGDGCIEEIGLEEAKKGLDLAIDYFNNSNYSDSNRINKIQVNNIKEFREFLDTVNKGKCVLFFG